MVDEKSLQDKITSRFGMTQLGVIAQIVEPVSSLLTISDAKEMFDVNSELTSLLVETNFSNGIISKRTILDKSKTFWDSLKNPTLDHFIDSNIKEFNSREHITKALDVIMLSENEEDIYKDFLIYHDGRILGIGNYLKLVNHITFLQNMELNRARSIQQFLLEKSVLSDPGFEYKIHTEMAHELGGDFYKLLEVREDYYMIGCFDVSGKDISASLATAILSSCFTTLKMCGNIEEMYAEEIINNLNDVCVYQTPFDIFIAGIMIFVDKASNTLEIYNLSYTYPYLFKKNEEGNYKLIKLNRSGKPLGLDNDLNLADGKTTSALNKGMKFFSFSDGFTDIRNKRGEMFGEDRLEDFIKKNYMFKPDRFISDLLGEVNSYMGGTPQVDDMTTLVLSF